jgi:MtN3 and saliva related transmembrane protein
MLADILGYIGGVLTTICLLPQLIKIYRSKSVDNVSLETYCVLLIGQCFWTMYGYMVEDTSVIVANVVSGVFTSSILVLGGYYGEIFK